MKIFLHIGDSRTGTTTFQSMMMANRDVLLKHGIDYPRIALLHPEKGIAQHQLPFSLLPQWPEFAPKAQIDRDEIWGKLKTYLQDTEEEAVLLSSEAFSSLSGDAVRFVKDFFAGHDVVPIFVYRDAKEWRRSMMEHLVKTGQARSIPEEQGNVQDKGLKKQQAWSEFFDVNVIEYGPDCLENILQVLGVGLDEMAQVERRNRQQDQVLMKLLKKLNKIPLVDGNRTQLNKTIINWYNREIKSEEGGS
ncbi:hypothetical protein [uncultured Pseudophaeobacter sp.]|nr:hypothetical protein [uncultured Pseudophaeobacter sp.]